jgi:hypothetical protein
LKKLGISSYARPKPNLSVYFPMLGLGDSRHTQSRQNALAARPWANSAHAVIRKQAKDLESLKVTGRSVLGVRGVEARLYLEDA